MAAETNDLRVAPDDEPYWSSIRATMKPLYLHTQLVNSRRGPASHGVREKIQSLIDLSHSYDLDGYEPLKTMKESGSSLSIRTMLAEYFGANANEIALTRNAMEGIATVLNGFDLQPGDEVVATKFCYDFNLAILRQGATREGVKIRLVDLPFGVTGNSDILAAFEQSIGEKTKLVCIPHVVGRTGLVFPVRAISNLARQRRAFLFVDGAHSAGHIDFRLEDLGCDAFAACLHKWMHGPRGTGFLFVRQEKIPDVWPLYASWSGKPRDSIEKFEEVGTVCKALPAAIPEMITFNRTIGQAEKAARFRYLRDRWTSRLRNHERVQLLTDVDVVPGSGFAAFVVRGIDTKTFADVLFHKYDIYVQAFEMEEDPTMKGIHLSPGLANTVEEIDGFVDAAITILKGGQNATGNQPNR